ncbi:VOC family protein [Nonomuraea sp. NPDC050643]|uniref:VOC family protein n=1 Tax=Nonomuraea sp. NPDC050643 TaxID=3155660 RepID=UPI0033C82B87
MVRHRTSPVIRKIDAIMIPVPDLDSGLAFYRDRLGHEPLWRDDELGQAGLALPDSDTEIVLTTRLGLAPTWLVTSADTAAAQVVRAGGGMVAEPVDVPVGRLAVVADPFGNDLVLIDLSKGRYVTDESGLVTGVRPPAE